GRQQHETEEDCQVWDPYRRREFRPQEGFQGISDNEHEYQGKDGPPANKSKSSRGRQPQAHRLSLPFERACSQHSCSSRTRTTAATGTRVRLCLAAPRLHRPPKLAKDDHKPARPRRRVTSSLPKRRSAITRSCESERSSPAQWNRAPPARVSTL